jgi:hypothetical protein
MKQFISTKFFRVLQEISQTGINMDTQILQNSYDEFVILLFQGIASPHNKAMYHSTLVYTRVELAGLTEVSGKKCSNLSAQCDRTD